MSTSHSNMDKATMPMIMVSMRYLVGKTVKTTTPVVEGEEVPAEVDVEVITERQPTSKL